MIVASGALLITALVRAARRASDRRARLSIIEHSMLHAERVDGITVWTLATWATDGPLIVQATTAGDAYDAMRELVR